MKSLRKFKNVYLHRAPVDGRKQINGLAAVVEGEMGKSLELPGFRRAI